MRKWNATMPREHAGAGKAHIVVAFKKTTGLRMELETRLTEEDAQALMDTAIAMMNSYAALPVAAAPEQKP